ncbi:hypothetical protein ACFQZC_08760 [Streptacidiphilus monticola]
MWAQLQAPAALPLLLELLVLAGWITWAVLLAHTLAETWWWARRLPALLRSSTPLTGLTRRGVAAVLVAAIAIGIITALRASTPPPPSPPAPTTPPPGAPQPPSPPRSPRTHPRRKGLQRDPCARSATATHCGTSPDATSETRCAGPRSTTSTTAGPSRTAAT